MAMMAGPMLSSTSSGNLGSFGLASFSPPQHSDGAEGTRAAPNGHASSASIQQKMMRQRQLALERQRSASARRFGALAQANQLGTTQQPRSYGGESPLRLGGDAGKRFSSRERFDKKDLTLNKDQLNAADEKGRTTPKERTPSRNVNGMRPTSVSGNSQDGLDVMELVEELNDTKWTSECNIPMRDRPPRPVRPPMAGGTPMGGGTGGTPPGCVPEANSSMAWGGTFEKAEPINRSNSMQVETVTSFNQGGSRNRSNGPSEEFQRPQPRTFFDLQVEQAPPQAPVSDVQPRGGRRGNAGWKFWKGGNQQEGGNQQVDSVQQFERPESTDNCVSAFNGD